MISVFQKLASALVLAGCALGVEAAPINFTSTQFETTAFAFAGASSDFASDSSPPSSLPLLSSVSVLQGLDSASASGVVETGVLTTFADVFSGAGSTIAGSTALFSGVFIASGDVVGISLDFNSDNFNSSFSLSSSVATIQVTSNGTILLNQARSSSGLFQFSISPAAGAASVLQLTLTSQADAFATSFATNVATLAFSAQTIPIPEPQTYAMMLAGLGLLGFVTRRTKQKVA